MDGHKLYRHLSRSRYIPQLVLQGLLNTLTALQRWEQHFLRICRGTGVATVVAWVHHVLGLPVSVIGDGGSKTTSGTEPVHVLVEVVDLDNLQSHASQAVVLFSSADQAQIQFELYTHRTRCTSWNLQVGTQYSALVRKSSFQRMCADLISESSWRS